VPSLNDPTYRITFPAMDGSQIVVPAETGSQPRHGDEQLDADAVADLDGSPHSLAVELDRPPRPERIVGRRRRVLVRLESALETTNPVAERTADLRKTLRAEQDERGNQQQQQL
jgi:hypothetical protein